MLISTLFAGASAATYAGYKNLEGNVEFAAAFSGISALAGQALENGSSHARMILPSSTISCSEGVLTFSSAGRTVADSLPARCDFRSVVLGGMYYIKFTFTSFMLMLQVT